MMRKTWLMVLLLALPRIAHARMSRANFQVSAYVVNNCAVRVPPALPLPTYSGTAVHTSATFMLKCTKGAAPLVSVRSTSIAGGEMPALTGAGVTLLYYGIFSDSEYTKPWGAVSGPVGDGATFKSYSMYVVIPAGQSAARGSYSGTIDISVDSGGRSPSHYIVRLESRAN